MRQGLNVIPTEAEAGFDVRITPDLKPKARRGREGRAGLGAPKTFGGDEGVIFKNTLSMTWARPCSEPNPTPRATEILSGHKPKRTSRTYWTSGARRTKAPGHAAMKLERFTGSWSQLVVQSQQCSHFGVLLCYIFGMLCTRMAVCHDVA